MIIAIVDNAHTQKSSASSALTAMVRSAASSADIVKIIATFSDAKQLIATGKCDAIIMSGAHKSIRAATFDEIMVVGCLLTTFSKTPIYATCFAAHLMVEMYGGTVQTLAMPPHGLLEIRPVQTHDVLQTHDNVFKAYHGHDDAIVALPANMHALSVAVEQPRATMAFVSNDGLRMGVHYHPEKSQGDVTKTISRFLAYARTKGTSRCVRCCGFGCGCHVHKNCACGCSCAARGACDLSWW